MSETNPSYTVETRERYAHFLQRTKDTGVVGHRGSLKATRDLREFRRVLRPGDFLANNEVTFLTPPPDDFLAAIRGAAPKVPGALAVPVDPQEHRRLLEETGYGLYFACKPAEG